MWTRGGREVSRLEEGKLKALVRKGSVAAATRLVAEGTAGVRTRLDLSGCELGDRGSKALGAALASPGCQVEEVCLRGCRLSMREKLRSLSAGLEANVTVTRLDLSGNAIDDRSCANLARAVASTTTLQVIDLSINAIGDDGYRELAEALAANGSIRQLHIGHNRRCGLQAFLLAVASCRSLKILDLLGLPIPHSLFPTLFDLARRRPDLAICFADCRAERCLNIRFANSYFVVPVRHALRAQHRDDDQDVVLAHATLLDDPLTACLRAPA
mmetsp:Transcript_18891/g.59351  ORF Transcript_18891/g.59351 Transcript_18891/m.59351 type:complete len:271 (-) Transcript_18891:272-1084(-)